ncbi:exonuclease [Paenibacillus phage Wanderer]|nr:exonuclease [Paenibacillus phage Wanderer]AXF39468.1 NTP-binding protein [Paenibacillus phage Wanderer]
MEKTRAAIVNTADEERIQFSHSRVNKYETCPRQYQFRYVDKIQVVHGPDADNDMIVGNALHQGAEHGEKSMLEWYYAQFPIIEDNHVDEMVKLCILLSKLRIFLDSLDGNFRHEYEIDRADFKGFVDLIVSNPDGSVDVYDFKYSKNVSHYLESAQLHLYKYYLEQEGFKVNRLAFIFIPKLRTMGKYAKIKRKKGETVLEFRKRIADAVEPLKIDVRYIDYDFQKVESFWNSISEIQSTSSYPKKPTVLCDWCEYKNYCLEGDDTMILPKNERREIGGVKRKTLWIYGAPFSGKTWFTNKFPAPLMLNTDGNIDFVDSPFISIKDDVTVEGRITKRKFAWTVFKETINELEKKQNDFQTIIVDLLEDTYEHCRIYMYDKLGIEHESDNSFKAWDMVRTEFLSTMRRLLNLPYDIILISHEDLTKDLTRRSGDKVTRIAPNIQEKAANKIAGMVQLVARVVSEDDDRWLTFKTSEVEFGGGRLGVRSRKIPLEYTEFLKLYEEVNADKAEVNPKSKRSRKTKEVESEQNVDPEVEVEKAKLDALEAEKSGEQDVEEQPKRKRRSKKVEELAENDEVPPWKDELSEEKPKRTRRSRKTDDLPY